MKFEDLNLAPAIQKAVAEQGYETPTPIQAQAIPAVLAGHDLLAGAQTGTGKTAAFTLPLLHKLTMSRSKENKFGVYGVRALVLTPTRELAAQVEESVRNYVVTITQATRNHPGVKLGASPRASLGLYMAAQALAAIRGRDYVIPDDVKHIVIPALAHRLIPRTEARLRGRSAETVIKDVIVNVPVPVEEYGRL